MKKELQFLCCFCNQSISSSNMDPAEINILINIDKSNDRQYNQTFFCHTLCFKERLDDKIKISFYLQTLSES